MAVTSMSAPLKAMNDARQKIIDSYELKTDVVVIMVPGYSVPRLLEEPRLGHAMKFLYTKVLSTLCYFCHREETKCICDFIMAYDEKTKTVVSCDHLGYSICKPIDNIKGSFVLTVSPLTVSDVIEYHKDSWMLQNVF